MAIVADFFSALLEVAIELLVAALEFLFDLVTEIVRLAHYAISARYRAEIDAEFRDRRPVRKWLELSRKTLFVIAVLLATVAFLLLRATRAETEAHNNPHRLRAIERSIMSRLHKPHPQD